MIYAYCSLAYLVFSYLYWTAVSTGIENKASLTKRLFPTSYKHYWLFEESSNRHWSAEKHFESKVDVFFLCSFWPLVFLYIIVEKTLGLADKVVRWCFTSLWSQSSEVYHEEDPTTF